MSQIASSCDAFEACATERSAQSLKQQRLSATAAVTTDTMEELLQELADVVESAPFKAQQDDFYTK